MTPAPLRVAKEWECESERGVMVRVTRPPGPMKPPLVIVSTVDEVNVDVL